MTSAKKPNYTLPIIVMFFLFAMISFVTGFQNPFGVILKSQLGLSNLQSQLGNAANFIAYAFMGLPAGMILQKKGYKFSAIAAVLVGMVGVALMFVSSLFEATEKDTIITIYLCGAFVAGFSMCMLNTVVNPMLNTLGGGGKTGNQLLQFGGSLNSLSATICPVLVGYLMGSNLQNVTLIDARPALYIAFGIFLLAFVVLLLSKLPEPILEDLKRGGKRTEQPTLAGALKFRHYVGGVVAIFLYVGIEVGIPNMANLYMTSPLENGGLAMDAAVAGSIVGAYWFLMLVGRLVGGTIAGVVSSKAMLTIVSAVALALITGAILMEPTMINVPIINVQAPLNILLLVLCGLCTSVMWGGIFNLAAEGLGKYTAVASGFFMVMVCGGGILPLIQGAVADASNYMASYWVLFIAVAYLLYYAVIGSKVTRRDASAKVIEHEVEEGVKLED
ncbi:MAG: MFS transporter [Firmicutes bacterium]|nr:MFS transporter [Bacillota bacterium]MCM1400690.1 MFS transporter [Bacteroides sp.]MCM1476384.1 MFS transporter [Bacteroides sp.]